jgi:centrin-3
MEGKSEEWKEETEQKIRAAFELFDAEKTDAIQEDEIGHVMRALGAFPDERALVQAIVEMQEEEATKWISYHKFEKYMMKVLATKEMEPDSPDMLLHAFRTIDTDKRGSLPISVVEDLFTRMGTPFRPKELEDFLNAAKDEATDMFNYEKYMDKYANEILENPFGVTW